MKFKFVPLAAAAVLMGGAASADPFVDAVVRDFQCLGYEYIEIQRGPTQLKAQGERGFESFEVVYDLATGRILKQEQDFDEEVHYGPRGVEFATRLRDFVEVEDEEDDDDRDEEEEEAEDDDDVRDEEEDEDEDDDDDARDEDEDEDEEDDHDDDHDEEDEDEDEGDESGDDDDDDDDDQ